MWMHGKDDRFDNMVLLQLFLIPFFVKRKVMNPFYAYFVWAKYVQQRERHWWNRKVGKGKYKFSSYIWLSVHLPIWSSQRNIWMLNYQTQVYHWYYMSRLSVYCTLDDISPLFYPSFPRGEGGWGDLKHLHYHRICFGVLILAQW